MYLKRHVVRRGDKHYAYLRLVQAFRTEQGTVRHRILASLGRLDQLKSSGQLDQLAAAFARLDPPRVGFRREVGPLLLVKHVLERLGLVALVDRHVPQRGRAELTTGEVVAALIANRLCAPAPLYDIAAWGGSAALHEVLGIPGMLLNDDRLGRALEAFAPVGESVRGAAALAAVEAFRADGARLHVDLTTLRVAGAYADSELVGKGWGSDRRVARQVRMLQATNPDGIPLYVRPHAGNAAELTCIGMALERLAALLGPGLLVCVDSALGHFKNLCAAHRAGLRFVVPLRDSTGFMATFLDKVGPRALRPLRYVSKRQQGLPTDKRSCYRGAIRPLIVTDPETSEPHRFRVAFVWSSEEASSVADARERALSKAEAELAKVRRGRGGHYYKTLQQVDARVANILIEPVRGFLVVRTGLRQGKPCLRWRRNRAAIAAAARSDGIYALATNLTGRLSVTRVLRLYKNQFVVEQRHRDAKQTLRVRPLFLHNDDRIAALISTIGLALLVFGIIEAGVRRALGPGQTLPAILPEHRAAPPTGRSILAAFQGLGLTYTENGPRLDPLTATQRRILQLLDVPIPWIERDNLPAQTCGKRG
ncbi:MAG TPA: IS1634 family transposase [Burkholderiales bacterium]|nr:IS1634 family transposase [Burkholderiales bacterium]